MFGKLMTANDAQIFEYMTLLTDMPMEDIERMEQAVKDGANPRDAKAAMAEAVTTLWHGEEAAKKAAEGFSAQFQKGELPSDIEEIELAQADWAVADLVVEAGLESSKSQARRLLDQGAIRLNGEQISDADISVKDQDILQVGKRRFARLILK